MLLSLLSYPLSAPPPPQNAPNDPVSLYIIPAMIAIGAAIIGAVLGSIITHLINRRERSRKEITYQVRNNSPLVISKDIRDRIDIYLDKKLLTEELSVVTLTVWNSGNIAVKSSDYIRPITFAFEGRKVEDTNITDFTPKNLLVAEDLRTFRDTNATLREKEPSSLVLSNFHLNSKRGAGELNSYTVQVLLTGLLGKNDIKRSVGSLDDGRIVEAKFVDNQPTLARRFSRPQRLVMLILFMLSSILLGFGTNLVTGAPPNFLGVIIIVLSLFMYMIASIVATLDVPEPQSL